MNRLRRRRHVDVRLMYLLIASGVSSVPVFGQSATRDLSAYPTPGVTFRVSIAIDTPAETNGVGLEEAPPAGWTVSAISDAGTWDEGTEEVKWVFLVEPFPTAITYDVTPPVDASGDLCFAGTVSFDGPVQPVGGDACLLVGIPTISGVGLAVLGLLVVGAGRMVIVRRNARGRQLD